MNVPSQPWRDEEVYLEKITFFLNKQQNIQYIPPVVKQYLHSHLEVFLSSASEINLKILIIIIFCY